MPLSIYIHGQSGRMGRAVIEIAGQHEIPIEKDLSAADVIIDFSSPQGLLDVLNQASDTQTPLVTGTTGLAEEHHQALRSSGEAIPVLWSANMSVAVNLLYSLAGQAARVLGDQADYEILETHHKHKKDAPSGTALELGRRVSAALGKEFDAVAQLSRAGADCQRKPGEIGFSAVRAGDVVGEHTLLLALAGERLELTHRASDRRIFAQGALQAAQWLAVQPSGCYTFQDIFNTRQQV